MNVGRRTLFVGCAVLGVLVGIVGESVTGSEWWYLAIPGFIATGWLAVANPEKCTPQAGEGQGGGGNAT